MQRGSQSLSHCANRVIVSVKGGVDPLDVEYTGRCERCGRRSAKGPVNNQCQTQGV